MSKFLPMWMEGLPPEIAKKAEVELGETEDTRIKSLQDLRALIRGEKGLISRMDDAFLLRFLRARKFDVKKAFKLLQNYYTSKERYSRIITDFTPSEYKGLYKLNIMDSMPKRLEDGSSFGVIQISNFDFDTFTLNDLLAAGLMITELTLIPEVSQVCGGTMVIDMENISLNMLRKCSSPSFIYRFATIFQECLPYRVSGNHFVNEPIYFNFLFNIIKPFLKEKIKSRIHFHGNDMKSLHEKIPPELLPEQLGGNLGPLNSSDLYQRLLNHETYFKDMNKYGYRKQGINK